MLNNKKVTIVMPSYNSAKTLERTYRSLPHDIVDDVILVDDAGHDNTGDLARSLGIHVLVHPKNRGYGGGQKTGYAAALERGADIVVMVHPDFQYSPALVTSMAGMIASGHYDGVMASRMLGGGAIKGGMPIWKYAANKCLTTFENLMLGIKLSEYHTGYRAWSKEVLQTLPLELCSDDFIFDNQMIAQFVWNGFRFGEISCPTRYFDAASSINFHRSCEYGFGVLNVSVRFMLAKYGIKPWHEILGDRNILTPRGVDDGTDLS